MSLILLWYPGEIPPFFPLGLAGNAERGGATPRTPKLGSPSSKAPPQRGLGGPQNVGGSPLHPSPGPLLVPNRRFLFFFSIRAAASVPAREICIAKWKSGVSIIYHKREGGGQPRPSCHRRSHGSSFAPEPPLTGEGTPRPCGDSGVGTQLPPPPPPPRHRGITPGEAGRSGGSSKAQDVMAKLSLSPSPPGRVLGPGCPSQPGLRRLPRLLPPLPSSARSSELAGSAGAIPPWPWRVPRVEECSLGMSNATPE